MTGFCTNCRKNRVMEDIIRAPHNKLLRFIGCTTCGSPISGGDLTVKDIEGRKSYKEFKKDYDRMYGPRPDEEVDVEKKMEMLREGKPVHRCYHGMYDPVSKPKHKQKTIKPPRRLTQ